MEMIKKILFCGLVGCWAVANAAIVTTYDFSTDPGGNVTGRDGNMTVAYDGAGDYMTGTFGSQAFPSPETDAFEITLADFTGNYSGITQIAFDMWAFNVAPSDLFFRLIDGSNVFSYQFSNLAGITTAFTTFTVDLVYSFGWTGPSEAAFTTALGSIDAIEIEFSRNGTGGQEFRLDNLQTLGGGGGGGGGGEGGGGGGGGGGGPSAIPEPNTLSFIVLVIAAGLAVRRKFMGRADAHA